MKYFVQELKKLLVFGKILNTVADSMIVPKSFVLIALFEACLRKSLEASFPLIYHEVSGATLAINSNHASEPYGEVARSSSRRLATICRQIS